MVRRVSTSPPDAPLRKSKKSSTRKPARRKAVVKRTSQKSSVASRSRVATRDGPRLGYAPKRKKSEDEMSTSSDSSSSSPDVDDIITAMRKKINIKRGPNRDNENEICRKIEHAFSIADNDALMGIIGLAASRGKEFNVRKSRRIELLNSCLAGWGPNFEHQTNLQKLKIISVVSHLLEFAFEEQLAHIWVRLLHNPIEFGVYIASPNEKTMLERAVFQIRFLSLSPPAEQEGTPQFPGVYGFANRISGCKIMIIIGSRALLVLILGVALSSSPLFHKYMRPCEIYTRTRLGDIAIFNPHPPHAYVENTRLSMAIERALFSSMEPEGIAILYAPPHTGKTTAITHTLHQFYVNGKVNVLELRAGSFSEWIRRRGGDKHLTFSHWLQHDMGCHWEYSSIDVSSIFPYKTMSPRSVMFIDQFEAVTAEADIRNIRKMMHKVAYDVANRKNYVVLVATSHFEAYQDMLTWNGGRKFHAVINGGFIWTPAELHDVIDTYRRRGLLSASPLSPASEQALHTAIQNMTTISELRRYLHHHRLLQFS